MIVGLLGSTLDRAVNEWQNDCGPVRFDTRQGSKRVAK